jgi:rhodanese-related sulfurtransferase
MSNPGPLQVPTTAVELLPTPLPSNMTVLDVREPYEWDAGHIEGAVHIPLSDLPRRMGELDGERPVLCVCKVGARSAQAVLFLRSRGLDAVNLHGGMLAWSAAGRPVAAVSSPWEPHALP